jgi:hypothetical protein
VRTDQDKKSLELVIRWKGGAHTQLAMERPRSATETATPMEALEIIRRMAVRYGDDQIASVLNRRGYSTGKGKRWNQIRVATARRNHSIAGQKRALPDLERVSLSQAARICGVSHRAIERLVEAGLLKGEQVTPRAPWEIRRSDLDAAPIRRIIDRLHRTGKLILEGAARKTSLLCSLKMQEMIMKSVFRLAARRTNVGACPPKLEAAPVSEKRVGLNRSPDGLWGLNASSSPDGAGTGTFGRLNRPGR